MSVGYALVDEVAVITLNRPQVFNSIDQSLADGLRGAFDRASTEARAAVLTGAGKAFCAGADLSDLLDEYADSGPDLHKTITERFNPAVEAVLDAELPVVAAVNGAAAGAGFGIALACDLRVASDKAKFTTAFAKVGLGGDFGITWPLTRIVGEAKAKELLFLSDVLTAEQALQLALVNRVVPHDQHMKAVRELATRIARGPLISYRHMKENVRLASTNDYAALLDREAITQLRCGETQDHKEGVAAFTEKREPRFLGR